MNGYAQEVEVRNIDSVKVARHLDSLIENFGEGKSVPPEYELSFFVALSKFPELSSSQIKFKYTNIKTTLNARPTVLSLLFRNRKKRKYVVRVNSKIKDSLVTLKTVPFNAQIGLFGHELTHFSDYRRRSFFGVVGRLFSYATERGKETFEKEIDSLTIERGLGWQLYDWSFFVLNNSNGTEKYKNFKRKIYLEPNEIKAIITGLSMTAD